jgi:anti-sigma factor RsiW
MNKSRFSSQSSIDAECQKYARLLGAYVDGELEANKTLEIEGHVSKCETCRERIELDRAMRGTLKKVVGDEANAPDKSAMRGRMLAAMAGAKARGEARDGHDDVPAEKSGSVLGWRTLVPLSSAAALAIIWGSVAHAPTRASHQDLGSTNVKGAGMVGDPIAGFVEMHSRPWPMERTDRESVRALEQYVGVPVRPSTFEKQGAHLVGGRLMPVRDERAALLEYRIGQGASAQRVSVFIYDPRKIQVSDADLTPRAVGTAQVRVGRANGYSVAVTQKGGVGYALASDLDTDRSAELAALADQD